MALLVRYLLLMAECLAPNAMWAQITASAPTAVVFVCEHGSSKSLVAACHFNRLAEAQCLSIRAIAKGLTPDSGPPEPVRQGLIADGIPFGQFTPTALQPEDFRPGARVIALGCTLGAIAPKGASFEEWADLPAVSDGYSPAREAILVHVRALLRSLEPTPKPFSSRN